MDYIKIRFGKNLIHMHSRLHRTIDELFQQFNPMLALPQEAWRPQVDMYETPDEILVVAELSGVNRKDLEVEVDEQAVKITGMRRGMARVPGMKYRLAEIPCGRFERILRLPVSIDPEDVEASYGEGLLKITLRKHLRRHTRQIRVKGK